MQQDALYLFYFCDFRQQHSYRGILRSFLRQASSRLEELPLEISRCCERHRTRQTQPDAIEILLLLNESIKAGYLARKRICVIIDALDELEEGRPGACRELFLAFRQLRNSSSLSINVSVTGRRAPDLEYELAIVRSLKVVPPTSIIRDYENHLASLSEVYASMIDRMGKKDHSGVKALVWVSCAMRPLQPRELQHALSS